MGAAPVLPSVTTPLSNRKGVRWQQAPRHRCPGKHEERDTQAKRTRAYVGGAAIFMNCALVAGTRRTTTDVFLWILKPSSL
jgi:hypothetical protein